MNRPARRSAGKLKQLQYAIIAGMICGLFFSLLYATGALEPLELKTLDHRFVRYSDRLTPSDDIVIVVIDQNSIDYLKNDLQILWKWPRDVYAYTVDYLTRSGARAVLLDLTFQDPDINRADEFEEGETDIILGESIRESEVVITTAPFSDEKQAGEYFVDSTDYETLKEFSLQLQSAEDLDLDKAARVEAPITPIMESSRFVGYPNVLAEVDGVIRQVRLFQEHDGMIYPSTALATAMTAMGEDKIKVNAGHSMFLGGRDIPIGREARIYLNWYGPGDAGAGTFKYYPIADVFDSEYHMPDGQPPLIPENAFRDKIVLIGSNAPSLYDLKPTPMSGHGPYPGVEILATAINNLLDGTTLTRESSGRAIFTTILMCMLLAIALARAKSPFKSASLVLVSLAAYYIYAVAAFHANTFVNLVPAELGLSLTFVTIILMNYLTEGREKTRVKKAFSQYTSSALMEEILKDPEMLKLGGEKRDLSILFSDIRRFTSISEQLEPEQLTNILNDYLTPMTDVVFKHKGILDKYIGDAIMALFGAPLPLSNHPSAACSAALDMMEELERLRIKWKERGLPDFIQNMRIGIGINSGPVSVGNMGSNLRFDYTVIGDNVNLSSRLEGATKAYGVNIVVSKNTWERTRDEFLYREIDYIRVMGKQKPIRIYELLGRLSGEESDKEMIDRAARFESGLALYRDRKWKEAQGVFSSEFEMDPEDRASAVYVERCRQFIEDPPDDDWDRVFERRSK